VTPLLRFENVTLRRGGRLLFEALDLEIDRGEALQIVGPNGSGKSSLIRLAAGLLRVESGRVQRSSIALANDNLALDRELPLRRALGFWGGATEQAMDHLAIGHLADVPIRLLSSGQLKRATLARVVASGASLWLLDEPFNALDAEGGDRLSGLIEEQRARGGAVVVAAHRALPEKWRVLELPL
jgi:heme exporter protein A